MRVLCLFLGAALLLLWFGGHYMIFVPYDTAIGGGLLCLAALVVK